MVACSDFNRVVKPAWIFGANTMNSGFSARRSAMTSSNPLLCSSQLCTDCPISTSCVMHCRASGRLQLGVDDQALVRDRLKAGSQLTGKAFGLLEVARRTAEHEPDDEDLGRDDSGQQGTEF